MVVATARVLAGLDDSRRQVTPFTFVLRHRRLALYTDDLAAHHVLPVLEVEVLDVLQTPI